MNVFIVFCFLIGISVSLGNDLTEFSGSFVDENVSNLVEEAPTQLLIFQAELRRKIEDSLRTSSTSMRVILNAYHHEAKTSTEKYSKQRIEEILEGIKTSRSTKGNKTDCVKKRRDAVAKIIFFGSSTWTKFEETINNLYTEMEHNIQEFKEKYSLKPSDLKVMKTMQADDFVRERLNNIDIDETKETQRIKYSYNKRINSMVELINAKESEMKKYLRPFCGVQKPVNRSSLSQDDINSLKVKLMLNLIGFISRNQLMNSTITDMHDKYWNSTINRLLNSYFWSESLNKLVLCGKTWDGYSEESVKQNLKLHQTLVANCYEEFLNATNTFERKFQRYDEDPLKFLEEENIRVSGDFETFWYKLDFESTAKYLAQQDKVASNYINCMKRVIPFATSCDPKEVDVYNS